MKLVTIFAASASALLLASPAFSDTFTGKIVYKNSAGEIATKSGEVELTPAKIEALKMKIEGTDNLADKVKFKVIDGENRKVVVALFRNVRDMPEGVTLVVKGSLIEGSNGHIFYGDLFTRTCADQAQQQDQQDQQQDQQQGQQDSQPIQHFASADQSADQGVVSDADGTYLTRLMDGIQAFQDLTGCKTEYRGGLLLAHKNKAAQEH